MEKMQGKKRTPWYADFRVFLLILAVFGVFMLMSVFSGDHGIGLGPFVTGKDAPDLQVQGLDGSSMKLSDLKGKVVFLNFWATWCAPCRQEIPAIQSLYKKYYDQPDFVIAAVTVDTKTTEEIAEFLQGYRATFPVYLDPEMKAAKTYGVTGFPESFLIDRKGKIVHRFVGPRNWGDRNFRAIVDKLIAE